MISKFFVQGTTFNWAGAAPQPHANDGAFVASAIPVPPALTYAGLHARLPYGDGVGPLRMIWAKARPPASLGLVPGGTLPHVWLNYVVGRTAFVQVAGGDILTGFMSGCWIVVWYQGGARYVGHIGTTDTAPRTQAPNTTVKNVFRASFAGAAPVNTGLTGFSPANAWSFAEIVQVCKDIDRANYGTYTAMARILALVTRNNHFYSILMIAQAGGPWICGGRKRVTPSSQTAVLAALA